MDDTISRHEAIDELSEYGKRVETATQLWTINWCKKIISALPSVHSDRKKGKWIKEMRVTETEKYISYDPEWYCSCCGTKYDSHIAKIVNFCYVCGSDMRGEEDG